MSPGLDRADGDRRTLDHLETEFAQRFGDAGGAKGARAHVGAAPARPGFDREQERECRSLAAS